MVPQRDPPDPSASATAPDLEIAEDIYEACPCTDRSLLGGPEPTCCRCQHTPGFRLTKRILRPAPKPDFAEAAALAQIRAKDNALLKAANTLEKAAARFLVKGHTEDAAATKKAADAVRAEVDGLQ